MTTLEIHRIHNVPAWAASILIVAFMTGCGPMNGPKTACNIDEVNNQVTEQLFIKETPVVDSKVIDELDNCIANRIEQRATANALRVRKAMLLTMSKQPEHAEVAWRDVEGTELGTPSLQALHHVWQPIWWFYTRTDGNASTDAAELDRYLRKFDDVCVKARGIDRSDTIEPPREVCIYLDTIHIVLVNWRARERVESNTATMLAEAIGQYVTLFDETDRDWLAAGGESAAEEQVPLRQVRHRGWLQSMVVASLCTAQAQELVVQWSPPWIADLPHSCAEYEYDI